MSALGEGTDPASRLASGRLEGRGGVAAIVTATLACRSYLPAAIHRRVASGPRTSRGPGPERPVAVRPPIRGGSPGRGRRQRASLQRPTETRTETTSAEDHERRPCPLGAMVGVLAGQARFRLAEDAGFEPARAVNPTRFPSERHRPLGESSAEEATRRAVGLEIGERGSGCLAGHRRVPAAGLVERRSARRWPRVPQVHGPVVGRVSAAPSRSQIMLHLRSAIQARPVPTRRRSPPPGPGHAARAWQRPGSRGSSPSPH